MSEKPSLQPPANNTKQKKKKSKNGKSAAQPKRSGKADKPSPGPAAPGKTLAKQLRNTGLGRYMLDHARKLQDQGKHFEAAHYIAASIMCPGAFPAMRFQDGYDAMPTSLFAPFDVFEIPFSKAAAGALDAYGLPTSETWLFGFRDHPGRALIMLDHNSLATGFGYSLGNDTTLAGIPAGQDLGLSFAVATGAYQPHGPQLLALTLAAGEDNYNGFFPFGRDDRLAFTGLTPSSPLTITLDVSAMDGSVERVQVVTATNVSGYAPVVALDVLHGNLFGYIRIVSLSLPFTGPGPDYTIQINNIGRPVLAHRTLARFEDINNVIESFRGNGMMLMYSNTAANLSMQGSAVGWQVPENISMGQLINEGFGSMVNRPDSSKARDAKKGLMGFWKPSAPFDYKFTPVGWNAITPTTSSLSPASTVPLSQYLAVCIQIDDPVGRSGKVTLAINGEGRCDSPWFASTGGVAGDRAPSQRAIDLVRAAEQWHENPKHVSDIVSFLSAHKGDIKNTLESIGTNFPMLAPFMNVLKTGADYL